MVGRANSGIAPQIGADAFTTGTDIHFAPGRLQPTTRAGQWHDMSKGVGTTIVSKIVPGFAGSLGRIGKDKAPHGNDVF